MVFLSLCKAKKRAKPTQHLLLCKYLKALSKSCVARFRCSLRKLPCATQRVKSIVTLFAVCTSFVTAASFVLPSHFIYSVAVARAFAKKLKNSGAHDLGNPLSINFSRLSVHRLPIIWLACGSPRAAQKRMQTTCRQIIFLFVCITFLLVYLTRGINQGTAARTLFISPRWLHRSPPHSYLMLPVSHPRLHSQDGSLKLHKWLQSIPFHSIHCSHFSHRTAAGAITFKR